MVQGFRTWLLDEVSQTLFHTEFSSVAYLFQEDQDYAKQGYRRLAAAKFDSPKHGVKAGEPVWWHPETRHMVPVNQPTNQPSKQAPQSPTASLPARQNPYIPKNQFVAQPMTPTPNSQQPPKPPAWICATVESTSLGVPIGSKIALSKSATSDDWDWVSENGKKGKLSSDGIAHAVKSVKDEVTGKVKKVGDPSEYFGNDTVPGQEIAKQGHDHARPQETGPRTVDPALARYQIPPQNMSPYQEKVQNTFTDSHTNIMMNALAGTGKTTMLKHLSSYKKPGEKWLYLVFNKKNMVEAKYDPKNPKSFPPGIEVYTTHSFLGQWVLKPNSGTKILPHTDLPGRGGMKGDKISSTLQDQGGYWFLTAFDRLRFPERLKRPVTFMVKRLASLAKNFAIDPRGQGAYEQVNHLIDKYALDTTFAPKNKDFDPYAQQNAIDYRSQVISLVMDTLNHSLPGKAPDPNLRGMRDHDDTLWYAATHADQLRWPRYDVVLADEVQDFNVCQQVMLKKLHDAGARVVAVGDPNQAIYSFRGADTESFANTQKMLEGMDRGAAALPLPVNYRCCEQIVNHVNANTCVNDLICGRNGKDESGQPTGQLHQGEVTTHRTYEQSMADLLTEFASPKEINGAWVDGGQFKKHTALIARTNKPLTSSAIKLLKNDIDFVIIGKDFSEDLIKHVRSIAGYKSNLSIADFVDRMGYERDRKNNEAEFDFRKVDEAKEFDELSDSIMAIIEHLEEKDFINPKRNTPINGTEDFMNYLRDQFGGLNVEEDENDSKAYQAKDKSKFVTLTTAHRSKGLEFPRVFILRNDQFPHKSANTNEELLQEEHAKYVAYTRAEDELHILNDGKP